LEIADNNSATVQDTDMQLHGRLIGNQVSNGASQFLEWPEGHFSCLKPFLLWCLGKYSTYSHESESVRDLSCHNWSVTYTVTVIIPRKRCTTETLLLLTISRKSYTVYRIAPFSVTLSDLQGHSPTASLSECDFS